MSSAYSIYDIASVILIPIAAQILLGSILIAVGISVLVIGRRRYLKKQENGKE